MARPHTIPCRCRFQGTAYRLAQTYVALEDRAKGREHLLYALEIAPHYREAQQLLLEIVR